MKRAKGIKIRRCPAWLFVRVLQRKIDLDIENCCDPFNRMFGFIHKKVYYYTPYTLIKDYELKRKFISKEEQENLYVSEIKS